MKIDFEKIKRLKAERDEFLKEHPELQELQDELDEAMDKCNNPHNRAAVACAIMVNKWHEVVEIWTGKKDKGDLQ